MRAFTGSRTEAQKRECPLTEAIGTVETNVLDGSTRDKQPSPNKYPKSLPFGLPGIGSIIEEHSEQPI